MAEHILLPLHQLGVGRLHVDHQAFVDAPEPDHQQGRKQVQRDTLRRACVHAGRAGDRLRTGLEEDRMLGFFQKRRAAVVGDAHGQGAQPLGLAQAGERERRRAARGDRDQHIVRVDAALAHQLGRMTDLVLGTLDGLEHRLLAARDQQQQPLGRPAERRHQLGAVLHGEPPGGASAGINEPAAVPQARLHRNGRTLERRARGAHRGHRRELALDHGIEHVPGFPDVDAGITGVRAFRLHRVNRS